MGRGGGEVVKRPGRAGAVRFDASQARGSVLQNALYTVANPVRLRPKNNNIMRIAVSFLAVAAAVTFTGCAGPENKLGRGISNFGEIVRGGEMRRSIEQTQLWDGPTQGPTGFTRGFTRTMARTGIGLYEVVTFPLPPYGPLLAPKGKLYPDASMRTRKSPWGGLELSEKPVYEDSYKPGLPANGLFDTDNALGFSGGDVAPWLPGSRFSTLDY